MRETVLWIRSILFVISWYVITLILFILFSPTLLFSCKAAGCFPRFWSKITPKLLRLICGIQLDVQGLENLPQQNGYIIASKHQSAFETGLFHGIIPHVFYVLKKELLYIPIAGIYFLKTGSLHLLQSGGVETQNNSNNNNNWGGRFKREGTYVHLWLIHVDVWKKSNQYCKEIIFQLK